MLAGVITKNDEKSIKCSEARGKFERFSPHSHQKILPYNDFSQKCATFYQKALSKSRHVKISSKIATFFTSSVSWDGLTASPSQKIRNFKLSGRLKLKFELSTSLSRTQMCIKQFLKQWEAEGRVCGGEVSLPSKVATF